MEVMESLIFLLLVGLSGYWLVGWCLPEMEKELRIIWGGVLGLVMATLVVFGLSSFWGLSRVTVWGGGILIFLGMRLLRKKSEKSKKKLNLKKRFYLINLLILWGIILGFIFFTALSYEADGLWASGRTVWGDWAVHLSYVNSFVEGNNFPPEYPILAYKKLVYPFWVDFSSAMLMSLGLKVEWSMAVISWLLGLGLVGILWQTMTRFLKSPRLASVGVTVGLLAGGLGFLSWLEDGLKLGLAEVLSRPIREYTHMAEYGIEFINPIFSSLLPQRSILLGWPIWLMVIIIWDRSLRQGGRKLAILSGVLSGLLMLVHPHSALALAMVVPMWWWIFWRKKANKWEYWRWWLISFMVVGGLSWLWLKEAGSMINWWRWQIGWLAKEKNLAEIAWFWLVNLGVGGVLLLGVWRDKQVAKEIKRPFLAWQGLFLIPNFLVFQPWDYDNSKFFQWWYILSIPLVIYWLDMRLKSKGKKAVLVLVIWLMTFSGSLDVWKALLVKENRIMMADAKALRLVEFVKGKTAARSVWLTGGGHLNPVAMLGGRRILKGFSGWLWSYGLDYGQREADVKKMYEGGEMIKGLLENYGVNYVLIGPDEKGEFMVEDGFYVNNHELVYSQDSYQVFKVVENY